jgi:uncharacterized membrane protein
MLLIFLQEAARGAIPSPADVGFEETITSLVLWLILAVEVAGALLIVLGVALTVFRLGLVFRRGGVEYEKARLTLARFLALALELQLAADLLATIVSPSWNQLGKLGAIAAIRTGLNYFLAREVTEEERETVASGSHDTAEFVTES